MHHLKFPDALFLKIRPVQLEPVREAAHNTIFEDAAAAFIETMDRVRLMSQLPEYIVRSTAEQIMFDVSALYEAIGQPLPTGPFTPEQIAKIQSVRDRRLREEKEANAKATNNEIEAKLKSSLENSIAQLRRLCSPEEAHLDTLSAVESLLVAMLLQTWTAYESFMVDLWVVALNLGPKSLVREAIKAKPTEDTGKDQRGKSVPLAWIEKFDFDLKNNMGSLLREKFDFDRLRNIKHAYVAAFGAGVGECFNTEHLNPANVAALEAIRNVFAHRGGRSDYQFRYLISKCPASEYYALRDLGDGTKVEVDAAMVRDLWLSTAATAIATLVFVKNKTA